MVRALLLVACAASAWGAAKPKIVDNETVLPGPIFTTQPLVEVKNLRFNACTIEKTGAKATVISGELWNRWPREDVTVHIEVDLWRGNGGGLEKIGTAKATIERPGTDKPVWFATLAPACYDATQWKQGAKALQVLRVTVEWAKR